MPTHFWVGFKILIFDFCHFVSRSPNSLPRFQSGYRQNLNPTLRLLLGYQWDLNFLFSFLMSYRWNLKFFFELHRAIGKFWSFFDFWLITIRTRIIFCGFFKVICKSWSLSLDFFLIIIRAQILFLGFSRIIGKIWILLFDFYGIISKISH